MDVANASARETDRDAAPVNVSPAAAPTAAATLVFGLEERVPPATAILVGGQHVAAMVVGTITPPLLLARTLEFSADDTAYFISIALLASALGAFLQCRRRGPLGAGLLSVTGTSFAFVAPLTQAWHLGGFAMMFGMSCFVAPVQMFLAPFLPRFRAIFTPLVSGTIVLLIGLSLVPTAFFGLAAPLRPDGNPWPGILAGAVVIGVVVGAQATGRAGARLAGVAVAIIAGCGVCWFFGGLPMPAARDAGWLLQPRPLAHGLAFSASLVLPFAFIYLVSSIEAMGDMTATSQLSGLPTTDQEHWRRLSRGVLADGVVCTVAAIFGGFPSTTYAQNNGVIQLTGVASRRIGYVVAAMLLVLGLVPAIGRAATALPSPVLGALALLLFGLVAVSGLRLIAAAGLGQREGVIVALSLGIGLGLPTQPTLIAGLPQGIRPVFESGISAGGVVAIVLNAIWRR